MPSILHQLTIHVSPDKVYEALTDKDKIAQWWIKDNSMQAVEGTTGEFKLQDGTVVFKMEVVKLMPDNDVHWKPKEGPAEWENTSISWQLNKAENGTEVRFIHRGWVSVGGSYAQISYNWAFYLTSLKWFLERGKGMPYPDSIEY